MTNMPISVNEHLILENEGCDLEFYKNDSGGMFASAVGDEGAMFWFTITKEDWPKLREFIEKALMYD
jgi:hypothetical protein